MADVHKNRVNATLSDYIEYTVCSVCKGLGGKMKDDEATLLPTLHKQFRHDFFSNTDSFPNVCVQEKDVPSTRWLLSQLYAYFEGSIEVQCRQKRYGTLVYHKHCDLIQALTTALGKNNSQQSATNSAACDSYAHTCNSPSIEEQTTNVALFLNKKLHARARLLTDSFNESPESIATTDFAEALSSTDPHLMSFLTTLTQSVWQSKRNLFADTGSLSSISPRSCRLFYALSVLQFCTNSTCCVPLHALLAETVMCHGGTLELVHILNRLGAVASVETVNRLATHIVHQRLSTGVQSELQPQMFTAVSVDNIDILQPI